MDRGRVSVGGSKTDGCEQFEKKTNPYYAVGLEFDTEY